jgi:Tfp pilus assembly protein PilX
MQLSRLRHRCRDDRGFTMLLAVFVLMITSMLLGGAYVAVINDTGLSRHDLDQKRAYAAAQAGIQAYNYQLNQNVNYWELCTTATQVTVPGSTDAGSTEYYTTKPVVATTAPSGTTTCSASNPIGTMIESTGKAAGTFRISSTGYSSPTGNPTGGVSRTIVAQYRRQSFLNFVYYTDFETLDPVTGSPPPTDCAVHYPGRGNDCPTINFVSGDHINGPLHSEDTLAICGTPVFGRTSADQIEAPAHSDEGQNNCTDNASFTGTYNSSAPSLLPPPSNAQILNITQAAYHFSGVTTIVLNGGNMTVTNANFNGGVAKSVVFPSNGVVYVSTSGAGCPVTYTPYNPSYTGNAGCGTVYVSGSYTSSLTIASDNDIVINGNITTPTDSSGVPTGGALLGLIANSFVRIYHPVVGTRGSTFGDCGGGVTNDPSSLTNPTIYAAILAVNHSFIVDNYDCGAPLGTLTVYGAIAQLFRGPVGTGGGSGVNSGYLKNYQYDDRLATTEPPYFLNPVSAAWYVQRQTECDVAASC